MTATSPLEPPERILQDAGTSLRGSLTTPAITLMVVAMAAPLGSMIGNVPIGILLGNGPGLPVVFAVAGVVITLVAVGYIALSREVPEAGGFAAMIRAGLGERAGRGAAYIIALAYLAGTLALATGFGYFSSITLATYGIEAPWYVWSAVAVALTLLLGRRGADFSSRVLLVLMVAEFGMLVVLDIAILVRHGFAALTPEVFAPEFVFSGSLGPALLVGFTSYIGIETAIIYTKESKDPARSVPRATFGAVALVALFYVGSSWLIVGSVGVDSVVEVTAGSEGALVFLVAAENAGELVVVLLQIFFCLSILATLIALHNATVRYTHSLAVRGELPTALGRVHPRHGSPARASDVLAGFTILVLAAAAIAGGDPYIGVGTSLTGLFTIGVIGIQSLVAVAVIVYFRRRRDPRLFTTVIAPTLGGAGIAVATALIAANYGILTGTDSVIANALPALLLIVGVVGVVARPRTRVTDALVK